MDFGMLPPEINSARIYAGPGSGSMLAAASAWDGLAAELQSTAASYRSVISGLTASWQGPSSATMAAAAAPYAAWMSATAARAEQAATQARAAAAAYQTAFAATVPPPVIAANRSQLASLVATNIFGQNTPTIAATEAQYADMWAQDAAAMYGYAGSSATATRLTRFDPPPQTTNAGGLAGQAAAVTQATGTSAGTSAQSTLPQLMSAAPQALQSLAMPPAAPATADPPSPLSTLTSLLSGLNSSPLAIAAGNIEFVAKGLLPASDAMVSTSVSLVASARTINDRAVELEGPLFAEFGSGTQVLGAAGLAVGGSAVSADVGSAGLVGALSVPPNWAAATPTIRLAATVLQGTSAAAAPAVADSTGSLYGQMALASLAGSALGGTVPRAIAGTAAKAVGRPTSDKDSKTPEKLRRVLAELSQNPESVQHWHSSEAELDGLIAQLSKKPGIHAVHLSSGDKKTSTRPKVRWG
jgi:PPE-repeat protein